MRRVVALFGEAEKGQFNKPFILKELPQVVDLLGNPPQDSEGLFFTIQALLYEREVVFFRVQEEGFSRNDYLIGFKLLESIPRLHALCLPGVGDAEILTASHLICERYKSPLITSQKDLYDFLTA
ncbi:MAG: hypothetical protein FJZ64_01680 [Chlamydiae bacterium]|nr:hypothetical protein [Chlamydiota bacterium]